MNFAMTIFTGLLFHALPASAQSHFMFDFDQLRPAPVIIQPPSRPAPPPPPPPVTRPPAKPAPPAPSVPPPVRRPTPPPVETPADRETEAGLKPPRCPNCSQTEKNIRDLQALVNGKIRIGDLSSWRRSRGLVQMPTRGERGNIGPCGSFHYNPDRNKRTGEIMDNYTNPLTACAFMSLLQDWKKRCPDSQDGCRVAWGDISHKTALRWNGHSSHTHGNCIDIRPMRKGGFQNAPLVYQNSDRAATAAFIRMAKEKGATPVLYNDPKAGGSYSSGHHNHIHICFHSNKKTKQTCANYKYNPDVCGPN